MVTSINMARTRAKARELVRARLDINNISHGLSFDEHADYLLSNAESPISVSVAMNPAAHW